MAEGRLRGRRSLALAGFAALVVLSGLGVGVATTTPEDTALDGPPAPAPSAATSGPAPATASPRASSSPAVSRTAGKADPRSARQQIALHRANGAWPGADGLSGVNGDPVLDTAAVRAFCTARGRPCRVAQTYTDRSSWETMTSGTAWTFDLFSDFDGVLVVSQGLVPEGAKDDLASCAAGDHDEQWRAFGTLMRRHYRGDSVVRLGWEFNEQTSSWRADDPRTWLACYRRAADNIRATNPDVLLDWTINAHNTPAGVCGGVSTNCYPGDDYVDIIGIDNYDHYPWSPSKAAFDRTAARPEGLTWLYEFARAHGKPFAVGEWGVVPTADAGRENPGYVQWMHEWFAAHAAHLAYEAYFSDCSEGGVQSSLFRTDDACRKNPGSAARYADLFGT
ncbi:cellulase family glycosylhydrolase [Couchioplanes caeruleus]|uniref:glycoside hydrolase family 26 protein n=1 Tax=Couchioplanes caeruleus TaxID=56438 RepID=UPI00201C8F65|nr:glycosyl hydrolase [Couchioplanes caeruleus]UQU66938.1 cellulase family glycosylhydrolase [Couchioplanes caeruleus]